MHLSSPCKSTRQGFTLQLTATRPRRFGKSLLLDTLRCLFEGRGALFEGLYIHYKWDWQTQHPVICLGFAAGIWPVVKR
ncbi:AAA family ATPase [Halomonas sp. HAL1]|uniref:AAA family ATPase n=1 Tax=Halomonas sp. HAL1 TaxID=550984 RepID=UPI001EE659F3|nr:AAA family ATPase [Halomonas sp. HAL1]WKV92399.1 AAA family ATPase [Halomonas sp. HAL1]